MHQSRSAQLYAQAKRWRALLRKAARSVGADVVPDDYIYTDDEPHELLINYEHLAPQTIRRLLRIRKRYWALEDRAYIAFEVEWAAEAKTDRKLRALN